MTSEIEPGHLAAPGEDIGNGRRCPPIPWVRFTSVNDHVLTPEMMCLWWVPCPDVQVFVGRVAHWPAADCAMIRRQSGSMVRAAAGTYFAVITAPQTPPVIDDALPITVTGSTASASPCPLLAGQPLPLELDPAPARPSPPESDPPAPA